MGVRVRCVRAQAITTGKFQEFKVAGFGTPKAAIVFMTRTTTNITPVDSAAFSFGVTDGVRQYSSAMSANDGTATSDYHRRISNTKLITLIDPATGNLEAEASFSAWIPDGIRISWDDLPSTAKQVTVVLFGGIKLQAYAGDYAISTSDQDITAPGFPVDQIVSANNESTAWDTTDTDNQNLWYELSVSGRLGTTINNALKSYGTDNNTESNIITYATNSLGGETTENAMEYYDLDDSGFSVQDLPDRTGVKCFYLALGYSNAVKHWVGDIVTKTAIGDQFYNDPNFEPQFVMHLINPVSSDVYPSPATTDTDGAGSMGVAVFTGDEQFLSLVTDEQSAATMNTQSYSQARPGTCRLGSQSIVWAQTFTQMTDTGWRVDHSANETRSARHWPTLVIGTPIVRGIQILGGQIMGGQIGG